MRRIFPLKSTSNHGHSGEFSGRESPRSKSRDPPEIIKRTSSKGRKSDASTSEDVSSAASRNKREHWCPSCPAAENGVRCDTPPSGDENTVVKEEEKSVISPMREILRQSHRNVYGCDTTREREADLDLDEALKSVVAGAMRSSDFRGASIDKYSSRRSGLGDVDDGSHERLSKPQAKSRLPPTPGRANSAPKVRPQPPVSGPEVTRLHSMRMLNVPDRVFDAQSPRISYSPRGLSPRVSEASSSNSNESLTPRSRLSNDRRISTSGFTPKSSSRAYSLNEGQPRSLSDKAVTIGQARKSLDSPRLVRKEVAPPLAADASEKASKYSGARIVAERLAKAFRSTSRTAVKGGKSSIEADRAGSSKSSLGHPTRMFVEHSDASYDGSCSDNSLLADDGVSLVTLLPHVRPGETQVVNPRKESNVLSWQEFIGEGKSLPPRSNESSGVSARNLEASGFTSAEQRTPVSGGRRMPSPGRQPRLPATSGSHQDDREKEVLKSWLEGLKRQSEGLNDDLEVKARQAEERISKLSGEQSVLEDQLDIMLEEDNGQGSTDAGIRLMQQRIRQMYDDKKRLALEVAAEVKRRITERAAAKEVLVMMKREMEACVRVMEKEKLDLQDGFDRELERRENDWYAKFEKSRSEENWLRDKVRRLEEEKGTLQSELEVVSSKENNLREKVREFELQMDGHRKRVEGAEKTILDLRHSLANSIQQTRQAESEVEMVKKAYLETERESQKLSEQVERLQKLCKDHETSIQGLQLGLKNGYRNGSEYKDGSLNIVRKELVRLSEIEKSLRLELESVREEAINLRTDNRALKERLEGVEDQQRTGITIQNLKTEIASLQLRTAELQDENISLSFNLKETLIQRDSGKEALKSLESSLSGIEKDNKNLQEEIGREKCKVQERERDIQRLERRVDGLVKNNQMLQNILALREKAAQVSDEEAKEKEKVVREAQQMEVEMRESLQVSARQLCYMNERAELMNDKLLEKESQLSAVKSECAKKDEVVRGLEQSLGDLSKSLDAQNRRIMQLTSRNEELFRLYHAKSKEVEDLHSKMIGDTDIKKINNQELDQLAGRAKDVQQELEAQNMMCKLLKEKLIQREDDLKKQSGEVASLEQSRDWLQIELSRVQSALAEATHRITGLERTLAQKEDLLSSLQSEKKETLKELSKLRQDLPRAERDRDQIQDEAEEIGREALRLSAEVEVLRRKVAQLEEDVMPQFVARAKSRTARDQLCSGIQLLQRSPLPSLVWVLPVASALAVAAKISVHSIAALQ
ncbi:hypothetical protein R1flu_002655 [Riccia fluitans]|uniref:Uncharacterized protein n=1 Tax=Riccia fluitans TaxID=41844 RepID=A0ABD1Y6X7_9MARC